MKKIELFERAIAEQAGSLKEWGINHTLFWAYRNSIAAGNEEINYEDVIWDYDIEEITKNPERERHQRIYHQQHLLKPDPDSCGVCKARFSDGWAYRGQGKIHGLGDRQAGGHSSHQDEGRGGVEYEGIWGTGTSGEIHS